MIGKMMMTDPRFIPPSDRDPDCLGWLGNCHWDELYERLCRHATFMDERDARQRSLIRRLTEVVAEARDLDCVQCDCDDERVCLPARMSDLLVEARGVEATNE